MFLTPADTEKLLLSVAGMVARDRLERGVLLNHPESLALLSCWVMERAREGATVERLMADGVHVLFTEQVMPGVPEMIPEMQVEATFPDGRKLVPLSRPIRPRIGPQVENPPPDPDHPGALRLGEGAIPLNAGRATRAVVVCNDGDRPVQIGSHIHLADTNAALVFTDPDDPDAVPDRELVRGFRLDIPAGTSLRLQPGDDKPVTVVALAGRGAVPGIQVRTTTRTPEEAPGE
jgi:urease subunit gamma/beta